jgi:hypothetical protein
MKLPIHGILVSLALFTATSHAEERFQVLRTTIPASEGNPIAGFLIITDSHRFTFVPPPGASVKALSQKGTIEIGFSDGRLPFKLEVVSQDASLSPLGTAQIQQQLLTRYPNAQITSTSECYSGIGNGFGYRIEYTTEAKAKVVVMAHSIPFQGGLITVSQAALDEKHLAKRYVIGQLLNSLHSEKLKGTEQKVAAN